MSDKIVTIGGKQTELAVDHQGRVFRSGDAEIELVATKGSEAEIRAAGKSYVVPFVVRGTTVSFAFDGEIYTADVSDKGSRAHTHHRDHSTAAPMPGVVLKILVKAGDVVKKNAALVVLEAMKMEHQIVAPYDGVVESVNCTEGEMVQPGVELVSLTVNDGRQ
ncbi:MAG TPA: biotin/lipoyl-containing protein [Thermoanaerobaculia bacterium]